MEILASLPPERIAKFWSKVEKTETCWTWTGQTKHGYGITRIYTQRYRAHRVAYELEVSTIPAGMVIDHKCHNKDLREPRPPKGGHSEAEYGAPTGSA